MTGRGRRSGTTGAGRTKGRREEKEQRERAGQHQQLLQQQAARAKAAEPPPPVVTEIATEQRIQEIKDKLFEIYTEYSLRSVVKLTSY